MAPEQAASPRLYDRQQQVGIGELATPRWMGTQPWRGPSVSKYASPQPSLRAPQSSADGPEATAARHARAISYSLAHPAPDASPSDHQLRTFASMSHVVDSPSIVSPPRLSSEHEPSARRSTLRAPPVPPVPGTPGESSSRVASTFHHSVASPPNYFAPGTSEASPASQPRLPPATSSAEPSPASRLATSKASLSPAARVVSIGPSHGMTPTSPNTSALSANAMPPQSLVQEMERWRISDTGSVAPQSAAMSPAPASVLTPPRPHDATPDTDRSHSLQAPLLGPALSSPSQHASAPSPSPSPPLKAPAPTDEKPYPSDLYSAVYPPTASALDTETTTPVLSFASSSADDPASSHLDASYQPRPLTPKQVAQPTMAPAVPATPTSPPKTDSVDASVDVSTQSHTSSGQPTLTPSKGRLSRAWWDLRSDHSHPSPGQGTPAPSDASPRGAKSPRWRRRQSGAHEDGDESSSLAGRLSRRSIAAINSLLKASPRNATKDTGADKSRAASPPHDPPPVPDTPATHTGSAAPASPGTPRARLGFGRRRRQSMPQASPQARGPNEQPVPATRMPRPSEVPPLPSAVVQGGGGAPDGSGRPPPVKQPAVEATSRATPRTSMSPAPRLAAAAPVMERSAPSPYHTAPAQGSRIPRASSMVRLLRRRPAEAEEPVKAKPRMLTSTSMHSLALSSDSSARTTPALHQQAPRADARSVSRSTESSTETPQPRARPWRKSNAEINEALRTQRAKMEAMPAPDQAAGSTQLSRPRNGRSEHSSKSGTPQESGTSTPGPVRRGSASARRDSSANQALQSMAEGPLPLGATTKTGWNATPTMHWKSATPTSTRSSAQPQLTSATSKVKTLKAAVSHGASGPSTRAKASGASTARSTAATSPSKLSTVVPAMSRPAAAAPAAAPERPKAAAEASAASAAPMSPPTTANTATRAASPPAAANSSSMPPTPAAMTPLRSAVESSIPVPVDSRRRSMSMHSIRAPRAPVWVDDTAAADEEMEQHVQRMFRRKVAAGAKLEVLEQQMSFPQAGAPSRRLSPRQAEVIYGNHLCPYELKEMFGYESIYYVGSFARHKHYAVPDKPDRNYGYDDERGDYIVNTRDHLAYRYEIIKTLGRGSFGQVLQCKDHQTGRYVAIKLIRNKRRFHHQALVEVKIMDYLTQADPNWEHSLVHMSDSFTFREHLCVTMELLSINLYELIKANNFEGFSTTLIRRFTLQALTCLSLMQKANIVHCDLKPENILLADPRKSEIRVIDFGSSCFVQEKVYTYIQSRFYRSPEVILGIDYNTAIDMWSLGCILAELHTGYPLFPGENEQDQLASIMEVLGLPDAHLLEKSTRRKMFFDSTGAPRAVVTSRGHKRRVGSRTLASAVKSHDELFLDFIAKCLIWDPERRLKADAALRHPWFLQRSYQDVGSSSRLPLSRRSGRVEPVPRSEGSLLPRATPGRNL